MLDPGSLLPMIHIEIAIFDLTDRFYGMKNYTCFMESLMTTGWFSATDYRIARERWWMSRMGTLEEENRKR